MESINDKYEKIKEQCRIRQNRFYNKNRETILAGRKLKKTKELDECKCIFNLDKILSLLDESKKITNVNTLSCHKKRLILFFSITKIENLETDLNDVDTIFTLFENATYGKDNKLYKLNTKKNILESVLFCLDNFDIKISSELRTKYQNFYGKIKLMSNDELTDKQNNDSYSIITWKEYESKIKHRFGIQSKEYLMISLYGECNARDDFDLYIVDDIELVTEDITKNYLIRKNDLFTICMQHYKTSKNKKPVFIKLSTELNILLVNYIKLNKIDDRLFPTKNGINSSFISAMNKKIDVIGSINTIRHIIISSNLNSNSITPEERVDLANNSFHSINTQIDYKRKQKNN